VSGVGLELLGIVGCVLLSALYSGSETALTALGSTGAQRLFEEDPRHNRVLKLWIEHPFRALTAILVGNNLVNITATALATDTSTRLFGKATGDDDTAAALGLAIGLMTFLVLTFGEITPKIISKAYSTRLAVPAMRFVWLSYYLFFPITFLYVKAARMGFRATGQDMETNGGHKVTEADIEFMVNLGSKEGSLGSDIGRMFRSVFEFSETTIREVMVPRVSMVAVEASSSYEELIDLLVACGHSRLPVYEENVDHIVGMFYAKDLLKFLLQGGEPAQFKVTDFMRAPVFVPTSKKVDDLFTEFQSRRIHIAVAVDEFGGTAGVVTLEDIIEEFFGEIQDEFDVEEPMLRILDDGRAIVDARINLDELEEQLGLGFPEEHLYESLGGFVSEQAGRVPQPGEELFYNGFRLTILESEPTHVVRVEIERQGGPPGSEDSKDDASDQEGPGEGTRASA
jgi:putative hemolysin